jgi:hypothetical protein
MVSAISTLIVAGVFGLIALIRYSMLSESDCDRRRFFTNEERWKDVKPVLKYVVIFTIIGKIFLTAYAFTPTTKEAIAIVVVPKVVNSETAGKAMETPGKMIDLLNNELDKLLEKRGDKKQETTKESK